MPKLNLIFFLFFSFILFSLKAQIPGFYMQNDAKKIDIPFELQDNFIIVKIIFQGVFPLNFIIDTGAEHTILTKKEITNLLNIPYERERTIVGTDMKTVIKAYIARKMRFDLPNLTLIKDILVLDDDYFKLDQFAGLEIHGIIGAETFKGYVLKIDYVRRMLTVFDPSVFKPSDHKNYEELPIEINRSKPYIYTNAQISTDSVVPMKLLLDTGAGLALLLHTYSNPLIVMPPKVIKGNIGNGLGGEIEGYIGRLKSLNIGSSKLQNVISHFQELHNEADSTYILNRNGLIGGNLLSRFTVIFDFSKEKLYLKPNKYIKNLFDYDKSGIIPIATGVSLSQFIVYDVLPNTPSSDMDIRRGDELLRVGWIPAQLLNLATINNIFQGREGKKITIVLRRNGVKMKKVIRLRKYI
jgi:predicted aspartyl protease